MNGHSGRDWIRVNLERLFRGFIVASVLALPIAFAAGLSALEPAKAGHVTEALGWIVLASTLLLTLPWLVAVYQFQDWLLPDSPLFIVLLLMAAWTLNASLALRAWRFRTVIRVTSGVATVQCFLLVAATH